MTPTSTISKSRYAYEWLKERITQHDFTPGYRLVLGTIAAKLDMSVVPVREAIRQLEAEGLVTYERNVGAHVSMVDVSQYRDSMQTLSFLESAATALSAPVITPEDLREARAVNERMADQLKNFNPEAFTSLNHRFHALLCHRCPNARLMRLVDAEWTHLERLRTSTFSFVPDRAHQSVREHEDILALIENGAPLAQIEGAARAHRNATLDAFMAHEHSPEAPGLTAV